MLYDTGKLTELY